MYIDFSNSQESVFTTDVCVIGAGAAGFACGLSFINSHIRVLIIEGGGRTYNREAADLHVGEVKGHFHSGINEARERIIGGTTTKWGGQVLPFMAEDFQRRDHVRESGWPISFKQLEPFYQKAEKILGTDPSISFDYKPWKDWNIDDPISSPSGLELIVTKWCQQPNFAIQHGSKLEDSHNVNILYNANVLELLPVEDTLTRVQSLSICSLNNRRGIVNSKFFIAAGGALETIRLFLTSTQFGSRGVGNNYNQVGCYFQDHIAAVVGRVFPVERSQIHKIFDPFYFKGFKYFPRIKLSPSFAEKNGILHASAQLVFSNAGDDTLSLLKKAVSDFRGKKLPSLEFLKILASPLRFSKLLLAAWRWKFQKRGSSSKNGPIWLEVHTEQEPDSSSYVELSKTFDNLGMNRISLNWTISDLTVVTIREVSKLIQEKFKKSGIGEVVLEPWVEDPANLSQTYLTDVYHQCGGLRMASFAHEGVVDTTCRVFEVDNLYVASSAVFPTSSFSNPTMTTIALALRVSESIALQLKEAEL